MLLPARIMMAIEPRYGACALAALLACAGRPAAQQERAHRPVGVIAADLDRAVEPEFDDSRKADDGYVDAFLAERRKVRARRKELIGELWEADPRHAALPGLLEERWRLMLFDHFPPEVAAEIRADIGRVLAAPHAGDTARHAAFYLAKLDAYDHRKDWRRMREAVEPFLEEHPRDPRGVELLFLVARNPNTPVAAKVRAYRRIVAAYPEHRLAGHARNAAARLDAIGKPFELRFTDAITGDTVDVGQMAGKVVLIDFWATWCRPCVAELPELLRLREEHRDDGLRIIGVSLDRPEEEGGLDALRRFVERRKIPWPQYYQGAGWKGELSRSLGITSIPHKMLVDREGILRHAEVPSKELAELVRALLAE